MSIQPFTVNIPQDFIDDLTLRLSRTRFPDEIADSGWEFGADLSYMKELLHYWQHVFDWKKEEEKINHYPNYIADIDDFKIHFIHIKGKSRNPMPLIMIHGWPGSFLEMIKIIPMLMNPAAYGRNESDSFDLVIPSMPGFGFSQKPSEPGMNVLHMAEIFVKLMQELGYKKFAAQGGDFGAGVCTALGLRYSSHLIGIHLNYIPGSYRPHLPEGMEFSEEEIEFEKRADEWYIKEGGYIHLQKTKPLTLAYGLNDSPAGLAAWIIEKYHGWGDCNGNVESRFTKDELLANISLYWFTETIHSSMRLYLENSKVPFRFGKNDFVNVPCGIAYFPKEDPFPPRSYIERGYNIQQWTEMPSGGHFAAMEEPELLSKDIRDFFRRLK